MVLIGIVDDIENSRSKCRIMQPLLQCNITGNMSRPGIGRLGGSGALADNPRFRGDG
jgi:hypothetical protein